MKISSLPARNGQVAPPTARLPLPPITGQNIAKGRRTKAQRINLAEALAAGRVVLHRPTLKQSAALCRVKLREVYQARRAGKPKLTPPAPLSLAEHLRAASPVERIVAAQTIGIDQVWDWLIAPSLNEAPLAMSS
jgi:hypothetical protein